jgi:peptide/nickel transport system substrate-binding protein
VLALVASTGLLIAGCGNGGGSTSSSSAPVKAGGTLHVSQGEEVITLDALTAFDSWSVNVVSQINETLFKVNAKGENEPWLVSDVKESPDAREWTFHLRQGVKFSDGKPMTSADVLYTLERARKDATWGPLLEGITSLEAPSSSTISITTAKSAPELEAILSQWSFGVVPKNLGGASEKAFAQHPVGTGPFMLGPWKHGESLVLERNPDYWDKGQPYLDKIVFQTVPNPDSRVAQLKGGQLDVIYQPAWAQIASIEAAPELEVGEYPRGFATFLVLNGREGPFKDPRAREAVSLALDREGIAAAANLPAPGSRRRFPTRTRASRPPPATSPRQRSCSPPPSPGVSIPASR